MKLHEALAAFLRDKADDTAVVELHNEHAPDAFIYRSIEDIADRGESHDRFFCWNGYGNLYDGFSSLTATRSPVDFDLLAEQIIENDQFADVNFDADFYLSDDE